MTEDGLWRLAIISSQGVSDLISRFAEELKIEKETMTGFENLKLEP
jgi:hypothetical protein